MFALLLLILISLYIIYEAGTNTVPLMEVIGDKWTVYGTMGCGWTVKQLDYMKKNGKPHTFVDCDNGGECEGMDAYPTIVDAEGNKTTGYKEV